MFRKIKSKPSYLIGIYLLVTLLCLLPCRSQAQCSQPTATDTSICGSGAGIVNATGGSKSLYNWYDESTEGNLLGTGAEFTTPEISVKDTFYVAQYDTGATTDALDFDGSGDYIAIEDYFYNGGGITELTVECWIKTGVASDQILASYDRNRYWRLEINGSGAGAGQIGFDLMTDDGQLDFGSTARVDDNTWHHIAAVYDNGTVSIYIDGTLDKTTTKGTSFGDGTTAYGFVGTGSEASSFDGTQGPTNNFNGDMDEFRIWDVARSPSQIASSASKCLNEAPTGIQVYYRMDGDADSLIDYSLNRNHGRLRGNLPTGWITTGTSINDCPNCESSRDMAIVDVLVAPSPSLGNDTCGQATFTLDAGPGYSSYTWNTGETGRFILADTTRFYYVSVDSVGTPCSAGDGISVSLLLEPTGTDTSRCGPGTVTLNASGGSGYYYWYDQEVGGTAVGSGTPWTSTSISETDTFYLASIANDTTRQGLEFDGVNDYVSLDMVFSKTGALPKMTVEAWVKTDVSGGGYNSNWSILDFDRSDYFSFFVHGGDGTVGFSTTDNAGTIDDFYGPSTARVNDGVWHHVVAVYDGVDKKIYVDGTLEATKSNPHGGLPLGSGTTRYGFIGDGSEATSENGPRNGLYFKGELDEIRLWSDERNLLEIQSNKDACILGVESNLLTYYKMENGVGSSTLTDHSNQLHTGTLRNMNTTAAWITDGPIVTCSCGDSPRNLVEVLVNRVPGIELGYDTCVATPLLLDPGAGMSNYTWQDGTTNQTLLASTSQSYSVTVDSVGTPCIATDAIVVNVGKAASPTAVDSTRCGPGMLKLKASGQGFIRWYDEAVGGSIIGTGDSISVGPLTEDSVFYFSSNVQNRNALIFDGVSDVVAIENFSYSGNGKAAVTIETWVKTTSPGDQIIASFDRSDFWRLEINGDAAGPGQIGFGILTDGGVLDMSSASRVDNGEWHHVAAVYDNGTATIYIDGVSDATASLGTTWGSVNTRFGFLGTGSEATGYNGTQGPDYHLDASIDEFRVWSVARSQVNIDLYKDSCLVGNEAGLELYYRMSTGEGSTINDFAGSSDGNITGATWIDDANGFSCSFCSESDRVAVEAKIFTAIDSSNYVSSCAGSGGSLLGFKGYGGTGNFDYRETSGIFNYDGTFDTDTAFVQMPNGGSYEVIVMDENACRDTLSNISTEPTPDFTGVGGSGTTKTCKIPNYNDWYYVVDASNNPIMAIKPNGNDLGSITATVYNQSDAFTFGDQSYMERHFVITPENQPTSDVGIRLFYSQSELDNLKDAAEATPSEGDDINTDIDIAILKYNGPTEDGVLDTSDATSALIIEQSDNGNVSLQKYFEYSISGFSEFWFKGKPFGVTLPVEFVNFNAQPYEENVLISWATGAEINNDYFQVEKSKDGVKFEAIHTLLGQGNSTQLTNYHFTDNSPNEGINYYRIKQVDFDGTTSYTDIQIVQFNEESNLFIAPNPISSTFQIFGSQDGNSQLTIQIVNANGNLVYNETTNDQSVDISHLTKGLYTVSLITDAGTTFHRVLKL